MSPVRIAILLSASRLAAAGCIPVEGDRILARDLARAVPAFTAIDPEQDIAYAPAAGARRLVGIAELQRWASRYGVVLGAVANETCFERALSTLNPDRLRDAITAAVADASVRVEIVDYSRYPLPQGELVFSRAGINGSAATRPDIPVIWRGRLRYAERSIPVWAKVRLTASRTWVEAAGLLVVGHPIAMEQLRLRTGDQFAFAASAAAAIKEVAGKLPKRTIRTGEAIQPALLTEPKEVERGDSVAVTVDGGALELRFTGMAETSGRLGETVFVRNPENGKRVSAKVQERGKVIVAAANRNEQEKQ
jgi:flagella basal body P-ring formation protein FlgA